MLICLDIDGVLTDLDRHMVEVAQHDLGLELTKVSNAYTFNQRYEGLTPDLEVDLWEHLHNQSLWASAPLMAGAQEAVKRFHENGHQVMCLSAAPNTVRDQRIASLAALELDPDMIFCVGTSTPTTLANKREVLGRFQPSVFVDDQLHNLVQGFETLGTGSLLGWVDLGDEQVHLPDDFNDWTDVAAIREESLIGMADSILAHLSPTLKVSQAR